MDETSRGFSRGERLRKRAHYRRVYEKGSRVHTPLFVLYALENGLPCSRLGMTVSRKIGKAVVRNRLRRRLREIFRTHKLQLEIPADLVVNVKRSAADASFSELRHHFLEAIGRWRRMG